MKAKEIIIQKIYEEYLKEDLIPYESDEAFKEGILAAFEYFKKQINEAF